MKKHHYVSWVIGILLLLVVIGAFYFIRNQVSSNFSKEGTLKVATAGTIFPNAYRKNNKLIGYDVSVLNAIAKAENYKTDYIVTDFDGIFGQVDSDRVPGRYCC